VKVIEQQEPRALPAWLAFLEREGSLHAIQNSREAPCHRAAYYFRLICQTYFARYLRKEQALHGTECCGMV
jgi:hypothetical protein